ncbi:carbohydrate sulfotransferase 8-like [Bombina bombina]|uniref:carbohydrate sulfotransferase 8-like n=1 Tax=Bombina bombina TaxID=8345 RepID=UPI00235AC808|nr:carbohydrate sulfotransferase 8-like [Bombina bombina]
MYKMKKTYLKIFILLTTFTFIVISFFFHFQYMEQPFFGTIENIAVQRHRKHVVKYVCQQNNMTNSSKTYTLPLDIAKRLFVEHNYKLIYCEVPKVGCSNWKRIILLLNVNATATADDLKHDAVHTTLLLKRLSDYSSAEQRQFFNNYTKVMFTRDPMNRLVSAYRDKLHHDEPYYGKKLVHTIKGMFREDINSTEKVTFEEFVQFILQEKTKYRDIHWKPMYQLCDPCNIHYDIIGKYETMNQDAEYVLKTIRAPKHLKYPSIKHYPDESRTNEKMTADHFKNLSSVILKGLLYLYRHDFSMFEYSPIEMTNFTNLK